MSKTLFSFLISELKIVRLICKQAKCGAVAEIPVERLSNSKTVTCPSCQMPYEDGPDGTLQQLGKSIRVLSSHAELDVEFVLPVKE